MRAQMITFKTTLGDIKIELDFENAPITAKNFQQYAEDGFYNGTIFHRVISNFMIQGGGKLLLCFCVVEELSCPLTMVLSRFHGRKWNWWR